MPEIGYGSNKKTKHLNADGFRTFLIHNPGELNLLLMHNRKYSATIAHGVSAEKRKRIIRRAIVMDVKVNNRHARLKSKEK